MKLPWLSGRRKWGAASAGMLASLLLAFSGQVSAGIADTKHNLGSGAGPAGRNQASNTPYNDPSTVERPPGGCQPCSLISSP